MAYVITDNCVSCGTCAANCPAEAIDMGDLQKLGPRKRPFLLSNFARREQRRVFLYMGKQPELCIHIKYDI